MLLFNSSFIFCIDCKCQEGRDCCVHHSISRVLSLDGHTSSSMNTCWSTVNLTFLLHGLGPWSCFHIDRSAPPLPSLCLHENNSNFLAWCRRSSVWSYHSFSLISLIPLLLTCPPPYSRSRLKNDTHAPQSHVDLNILLLCAHYRQTQKLIQRIPWIFFICFSLVPIKVSGVICWTEMTSMLHSRNFLINALNYI